MVERAVHFGLQLAGVHVGQLKEIMQLALETVVLSADADKINTTLEKIDQEAFEIAVNTILNAKHIYIIGIRSCAPLASFMAFYFNLMFDNVHLLQTSSSSEIFEQMVRIGKDDVIIGISFPRYSMRTDRKSTRLNSSHMPKSRMPSSA